MFGEKNRGRRSVAEAKAIERKAQRNGGEIHGRDASRLRRVKGSIVKYAIYDGDESDEREYD